MTSLSITRLISLILSLRMLSILNNALKEEDEEVVILADGSVEVLSIALGHGNINSQSHST